MTTRTLSDLESRLVMAWEWQDEQFVTPQDVQDILDCSPSHARKLIHELKKKRWLEPIEPGLYQFIPADRGTHAVPDMNPLLVGSVLVEPYYYSYATANHFYGFSPQVPATVYVATTTRRRPKVIRDVEYRFVLTPPYKFFGYREVEVYTARVMMAEPEKAVVDSLDKMRYAGGIVEMAHVVHEAFRRGLDEPSPGASPVDWNRLVDYALRMESQALVQRLGYLLEVVGASLPPAVAERLSEGIGKSKTYLGPVRRWGTGGNYNRRWQVVINVPQERLLGEIDDTRGLPAPHGARCL